MAASSPPQFFRIILHANLQDRKLVIPKKFVKDYGKFLSSSSVLRLKVPDGMEWKVGLTTAADGVVWMQKGWHQFAQHYGLQFGSLLVFRFHGKATFQTTIFDPTGLETEYSCSNFRGDDHFQDQDFDFDSDSDSDSDRSFESFPRHSKKRGNASSVPGRQSRSRKKLRNDDSLLSPKIELEEETCNIYRDTMPRRRQQSAKKADATQRFSSKSKSKSKSEKQPSFKVVISKSNVRGRFELIFPNDFAEKYLSDDEFGIIKLQISNGRNWPLIYKWSRNRGNFAYVSSGWKVFVKENLLKEGDIGFFQWIKKDKFLFTKLQDVPLPKKRIVSAATKRNNHPFFEVDILFKSYKNFTLNIPMAFAREHFSAEMEFAKLKIGNKEWSVKLKQYDSSVRFQSGWCRFYDDNGLADRDTCFFEMVNKKDCVFQVTIFKKLTTTSASMD